MTEDEYQSAQASSLDFVSVKQFHNSDYKTPRALFSNYYGKSLAIWLGYHNCYYELMNSISRNNVKLNQAGVNADINKINMLLISFIQTDFNMSDIPENVTSNKLDLTLGDDSKQTFYLAKKNNGDWYFTEKNFTNPETIRNYKSFEKETGISMNNIRTNVLPIMSYMNLLFGATETYGFTLSDAINTMDTSWLSDDMISYYSAFTAFAMNKIFMYGQVQISVVPGGVKDGTNLVMLYTSPKSTRSLFLTKKNTKDGSPSWIFNKQVQLNAKDIFLNDLVVDNPRLPLDSNPTILLWENIPTMLSKYGVVGYIIIITIIYLGLLYLLFRLIYLCSKASLLFLAKTFNDFDIKLFKKFSVAISLSITLYVTYLFYLNALIPYIHFITIYDFVFQLIYGIVIMVLLTETVSVISSLITSSFKASKDKEKASRLSFAVDIFNKIINTLIVLIVAGYILQRLGVDMLHFLTALGIGGIAIALAGKDTIENLFGSIILAFERPFKIGDWIIIDGNEGNVEKIGLRSTIVRTFKDSALAIPNFKFVSTKIDNMGSRLSRRYKSQLEIDENTPTKKIKEFINRLYEVVHDNPDMKENGSYIRVNDLAPSSIIVLIYVFFYAPTWNDELRLRGEFIMKMLEIAEELEIKLAPTQTIVLEKPQNKDH